MMKTNLELNGAPIYFVPRVNECFDADGMPIAPDSVVSLCAWCNNGLTMPLCNAGYIVSHSICDSCSELAKLQT